MIENPPPEPSLRPPLGVVVGWSVFGLLSFALLGGLAQTVHLAWGIWSSQLVLFTGFAWMGWQVLQLSPPAAMGIGRFELRGLGLGFLVGAFNYVAWAVPLTLASQAVFPKWMVEFYDSSRVFERQTTVEIGIVILGVAIAAPLGEEFFFRGFMQRGLGFSVPAPRAIVITAFVFSAFHQDPVGLTARFELGVVFGLLAWRARSIWPAIGAHAANNLISSAVYLFTRDLEDEALPGWALLLMIGVGNAGLIALVRFARLEATAPAQLVLEPRRSPARIFAPWLLTAVAATSLLLAVDLRGVRLNLIDGELQTGDLKKRDDVKALRAKVRRGEAEFAEYEAMVRKLKG